MDAVFELLVAWSSRRGNSSESDWSVLVKFEWSSLVLVFLLCLCQFVARVSLVVVVVAAAVVRAHRRMGPKRGSSSSSEEQEALGGSSRIIFVHTN